MGKGTPKRGLTGNPDEDLQRTVTGQLDLWQAAQRAAAEVAKLPIHEALAALEMARVSIEAELIERRGQG